MSHSPVLPRSHWDDLHRERCGHIRHSLASPRLSFLLRRFELALAHSYHGHPALTLRLDVVSCVSRAIFCRVVATSSINIFRHYVFASFTLSFHPTLPVAPIHAPHTLHTRSTHAHGVRIGHVYSARPPNLSPHSHPAHDHLPRPLLQSTAAIHMRIVVAASFYPPILPLDDQ
jgi:hypothetical protein